MPQLHYLTVQDTLWINLQTTKKVQHFNYARLEEATYYQYAYGASSSLVPQAGRFLAGFLKLHPFDAGNESTALVACATFLRINGSLLTVTPSGAEEWMDNIITRQKSGAEAVASAVEPLPEYHETLKPDIRADTRCVIDTYADAVCSLLNRSAFAK